MADENCDSDRLDYEEIKEILQELAEQFDRELDFEA